MIQPSMPEANRNPDHCSNDDGRTRSSPTWQRILKDAVRDIDTLAELLDLPREVLRQLTDSDASFPLIVPRGFVANMRKGDINDPLLRQVLPLATERAASPGYVFDPLEEQDLGDSGVIQKYRGRVLLISTGACPVHCRYCFRRHFPYSTQLAARWQWRAALDRVRADPEVSEVILSGGDPLSLTNARLQQLVEQLEHIKHVECVRIHTRFPIVIPERIDRGLLQIISGTKLKTVVVVHANHANEIDGSVEAALRRLSGASNALLNQSVLLRGVNDSAAELCRLSRRLFAADVLPYYLHLLDKVQGTAHFEVDEASARLLIEDIEARLPGYLVPNLVRETAGGLSKVRVA